MAPLHSDSRLPPLQATDLITPGRATISSLCGSLSFIVWLFAQSPQILTNYRRGSVAGLSLVFLGQWMAGDVTNLLGCILTDQLAFQKVTAGWFCLVDIVLLAQYAVYSRRDRLKLEKERREAARTASIGTPAREPLLDNVDPESLNQHFIDHAAPTANELGSMYQALFSNPPRPHQDRGHSYSRGLARQHDHSAFRQPDASLERAGSLVTSSSRNRSADTIHPNEMAESADLGRVYRRGRHISPHMATRTAPTSPVASAAGDIAAVRGRKPHAMPHIFRSIRGKTFSADAGTSIYAPSSTPTSRASSVSRGRAGPRVRLAHPESWVAPRQSHSLKPSLRSRAASATSITRSQELMGEEAARVAALLAGHMRQQTFLPRRSFRRDVRDCPYLLSRTHHAVDQRDACAQETTSKRRYTDSATSTARESREASRSTSAASSPVLESQHFSQYPFGVSRSQSHSAVRDELATANRRSRKRIKHSALDPSEVRRETQASRIHHRNPSSHLLASIDPLPRIDSIPSTSVCNPRAEGAERKTQLLRAERVDHGRDPPSSDAQADANVSDPFSEEPTTSAVRRRPATRTLGILTMLGLGGWLSGATDIATPGVLSAQNRPAPYHLHLTPTSEHERLLYAANLNLVYSSFETASLLPSERATSRHVTVSISPEQSLASPGNESQPESKTSDDSPDEEAPVSLRLLFGRTLSWLCTVLYLTSRLPQIYTNHLRRSVAGLSVLLFMSAFTGNLLYSISILTNPLADGTTDGGDYWRECLPFLLGSAGTLIFDAVVVTQWWVWGGKEGGDVKRGRRRRRRRRHRHQTGHHHQQQQQQQRFDQPGMTEHTPLNDTEGVGHATSRRDYGTLRD